jgi:hypothetical protein
MVDIKIPPLYRPRFTRGHFTHNPAHCARKVISIMQQNPQVNQPPVNPPLPPHLIPRPVRRMITDVHYSVFSNTDGTSWSYIVTIYRPGDQARTRIGEGRRLPSSAEAFKEARSVFYDWRDA